MKTEIYRNDERKTYTTNPATSQTGPGIHAGQRIAVVPDEIVSAFIQKDSESLGWKWDENRFSFC